jgi:ATP-binding cassette subfamily B protein
VKLLRSYKLPALKKAIALMGKRQWLFLLCQCGFFAVEIVNGLLFSTGLRGVTNALSGEDRKALINGVLTAAGGIALWWITVPVSAYLCDWASKSTVQSVKATLFEKLLLMPMREHDRRPKRELLSALTNDMACLQRLFDYDFAEVGRNLLGGISGVMIMALMDFRFAAVVLALGIVSITISAAFNKKLGDSGTAQQEALAESTGAVYEAIKGAKPLRLLHLQGYVLDKAACRTQREADAKICTGRITARLKAFSAGFSALHYAVLLLAGALLVRMGLSDWGSVVALLWLKSAADMLFVDFGQRMAGLQVSLAGVRRLFELLEVPDETEAANMTIESCGAALCIDGVSFDYQGGAVLEGFSMTLPKTGITALVGDSGAGKSTLLKLILGLYSPQSGRILFDGGEDVTLDNIRRKTAYVPQEPILFRGSVLENILFGNPRGTREDAVTAARLAGADGFVAELQDGFDTILTDDGKNLSGGQKQRLALARALVKNAPILLLDEITSALDKATSEQLCKTLQSIGKTKAILIVTHDAGIRAFADKIVQIHSMPALQGD